MRLVHGARHAWRWWSVQCMVVCTALQGAWIAVPDDLKANLPGWAFNTLCAVILVLGLIGRLVDQGSDDA